MKRIPYIISAKVLPNFLLDIEFDDAKISRIDIKPFIKNGISSALKNEDFFSSVKAIDGYITWPNGFDFCPAFLYELAELK